MAWEGKQFNPREEEKFLDDKLMEIGLLEPGMTLQEKRELASVVLESTRMAKEQMNQREKEDKWEVMILSDDDDKDCAADTSKGKAYVDVASVSSTVTKDKITRSKGKPENTIVHRELPHMIRDDEFERKKRGRENDNDTQKEEMEPLKTTAGEKKEREMVMKREKRDRQRKAEEEAIRERQMKGKEEERQLRERRKGDNRMRKEEVMKEDIEKSEVVEKPVDKTEELDTLDVDRKKEKGEIPKNSFYGPSHLIDAKTPNPFSKELYGSTSRRCPPRNNSLLKLVEEDMKNKLAKSPSKENEQSSKLFEKRVVGAKESVSSLDEDDFFFEGPCTSKGYGRERRNWEVKDKDGDKESPAKDDKYDFFHKGEVAFSKNESKKGGCRAKKMLAIALSSQSGSVGKNQEDVMSCEKRRREEKNGLSTRSRMDKCERKEDDTSNGEVKTPDEKKRRLEKGQLMRRWSDVAAAKGPQVSQPEENDGAGDSLKNKPKILLTPNKRWRRVKRNFKSAYGSGSEVDEWISSEEENKSEPKRLSKKQIVARIDNCLSRLKNALQNQQMCEVKEGNDKVRNHICVNRKYKVPPGFQEPDSDDEWNLWKICFVDKPEAKSKLVKSEIKSDTAVSVSNAVVTRSRTRQRNSISPTLSSKSASSVEEDCGSALPMLPLKRILPEPSNHSNDETQSSSKSPSMKEIALFNKVICPTSVISRSTQTPRDSDAGSDNSNSSSSASIPPSTKSKEVTQESKLMWDLLEVDDELNGDKKVEVKMLEEVDLTATEKSQPDSVTCPICSRLFPMSEIEAHAAVCNAEEEDESSDAEVVIEPKVRRENLRSQRMVSTAAGGSRENNIDMDEVEDFVGDNSHEEEDNFQPRPARLATFVPISQQKDSCIDYHDQFPELKNDSNLQASLARIRKKLMKAGTKKKGWRRRKKGRWKRVAKK